jgi:hypothetical protein
LKEEEEKQPGVVLFQVMCRKESQRTVVYYGSEAEKV